MTAQFLRKFQSSFGLKIWICSVLVVLADFFFYAKPIGWLTGLFSMIFLGGLFLIHNRSWKNRIDIACFGIGLFESGVLIFSPNLLSVFIYFCAISTLVLYRERGLYEHALMWFRAIQIFSLSVFSKAFSDLWRMNVISKRLKRGSKFSKIIQKWALPVVCSGIFVFLFSVANPLIDAKLSAWSLSGLFENLTPQRLFFWGTSFFVVWPFLKPALRKNIRKKITSQDNRQEEQVAWLFNTGAIIRSLMLFNILFLVQTSMDAVYLWGGAKLPEDMTYARYARQGAYPLIVTALLAAVFVLVSLRNKNFGETYTWIKRLIYVWVAQNIFLVISSILRTNLYIEEYSLSVLRFSALIWMGVVAVGLYLIIIRIALEKTNHWLINCNMAVLGATLVVCSVLDVGNIIANYNVTHCYEVTGKGARLDALYLGELGTSSLPALIWINKNQNVSAEKIRTDMEAHLTSKLRKNVGDWRAWTLREYLLCNYTNSGKICEPSDVRDFHGQDNTYSR